MQTITVLSCVLAVATAQLAAWPASSYSPYYQALFSAAQNPVLSAPVVNSAGAVNALPYSAPAVAVPAPAPIVAAAPAPVYAPAPAPVYAAAPAPVMAAPAPISGPAFAYAPSPVLAQVRPPVIAAAPIVAAAPAPILAAPAVVAPRVVPAYSPFARTAFFIGSNKAKSA